MMNVKNEITTAEEMFETVSKFWNDWLRECVRNNSKCQNCTFNHGDGFCFFSYKCIRDNFNIYKPHE